MVLKIKTTHAREVVDITNKVERLLSGTGIVNIFVKHTTAAITTADLDPDTDKDLLFALKLMTPKAKWNHPHDPEHFPDHLHSSLIGTSINIPFNDGRLSIGTWQRLVLLEFSGPRERELELTALSTN